MKENFGVIWTHSKYGPRLQVRKKERRKLARMLRRGRILKGGKL